MAVLPSVRETPYCRENPYSYDLHYDSESLGYGIPSMGVRNFLIVDQQYEDLRRLTSTLQRKFPDAVIHECHLASHALQLAGAQRPDAIVVHRPIAMDGEALVRRLRTLLPDVPILMVSDDVENNAAALAAGASAVIPFDARTTVGKAVANLLCDESSEPWRKS